MKKISVLVPTYNEQDNVIPLSSAIVEEFEKSLPEYDYEIVFIDKMCIRDSFRNNGVCCFRGSLSRDSAALFKLSAVANFAGCLLYTSKELYSPAPARCHKFRAEHSGKRHAEQSVQPLHA